MPTAFSRTTRCLADETPVYALIAWAAGALLLTAWLAWFFFARITLYAVSTGARLEAGRSAHPVAARTPGKIVSFPMTLGQQVTEGDVLAELDSSAERLQFDEDQARLKALPPQLAALSNELAAQERARTQDQEAAASAIEVARARYREAMSEAEFAQDLDRRQNELGKSGRIPVIEALRAHSEAQRLRASADAHASEIRRLERDAQARVHEMRARTEELKRIVATLEGEMGTIKATIARRRQEIEGHSIRAPVSGQVGEIAPLQIGAYVGEGDKLGAIVPAGHLRIVADFPPASALGRIHPGQTARMRLDGFPWAQYGSIPATVVHVASEIRNDAVRVEFSPSFDAPASRLMQHGLPGSIEISVEHIEPAVLVWRAAGQMLSRPVVLEAPRSAGADRP